MPNKRCKIPGEKYGLKPEEIYPDSIYPLKAETRFFQFTNKWSCFGFSYEQFNTILKIDHDNELF